MGGRPVTPGVSGHIIKTFVGCEVGDNGVRERSRVSRI
jgi:hypothetical protein